MPKCRNPVVVWLFLTVGFIPVPAFANTPTEEIQHTIEQVKNVVNDLASSDQQRKDMLRKALMPRFDWPEMAKQALGRHWTSTAGREREFVSAFADFLGNAYIGQIGAYRDEKILFVQESIEGNRAQVKTKIVSKKGEPTSVDYRLHRVEGEWKIYDVVVEDISIVVNYRSQFNRILAKGSLDDLLKQLREKDSGNPR